MTDDLPEWALREAAQIGLGIHDPEWHDDTNSRDCRFCQQVARALVAARRLGREEMREHAAELADKQDWTGWKFEAGHLLHPPKIIATAIRAVPLALEDTATTIAGAPSKAFLAMMDEIYRPFFTERPEANNAPLPEWALRAARELLGAGHFHNHEYNERKTEKIARALDAARRTNDDIARLAAHYLAGFDGDLVNSPARNSSERRQKLEDALREAGFYPPPPEESTDGR